MAQVHATQDVAAAATAKQSNARFFKAPFSEQEILDLQDVFLTKGLHYITVKNIPAGRNLISVFLKSLNYYHSIACITTSELTSDSSVTNMYEQLVKTGYLQADSHLDFETYLLEKCYFDFVWIEQTHDIFHQDWYIQLEQKMIKEKLDQQIPILSISYIQE